MFLKGDWAPHTGRIIWCALDTTSISDDDYACMAELIAERYPNFEKVVGISKAVQPLAKHLAKYRTHGGLLLVDDIFYEPTMERARLYWRTRQNWVNHDIQGFTMFSRLPMPHWVRTIWMLDVRTDEWTERG